MELDAALALADLSRGSLPPCSMRSDSRERRDEAAAQGGLFAGGERGLRMQKTPRPRSKSSRIWSEAEKEERRMRRVLANRESARETIRRRQAFREWLARRVSDLSLDNDNLKTEKELLVKEYRSLMDTNKQLKRMADPQLTLDDLMKVGDDAAANDSSFYSSADTSSSFGGCQEKCEWSPLLYRASPATCSWIRSSVHLQTPCMLPQSSDASRSPMATMAAIDVASRTEEVSMVAIGQQFCGKGGKSSGCHQLTRSLSEMTSAAAEARKTRKELNVSPVVRLMLGCRVGLEIDVHSCNLSRQMFCFLCKRKTS